MEEALEKLFTAFSNFRKKLPKTQAKSLKTNPDVYLGLPQYQMEFFATLVNIFQALTSVTTNSTFDIASVLDTPLYLIFKIFLGFLGVFKQLEL